MSVRFASTRLEYSIDGKPSIQETEDARPIEEPPTVNRVEFRFIWSHLVDWEVFEQWDQEPRDDSTNLDRRKYAAKLMVEIDSITRDHVERVFKYNLILTTRQLRKLSEAYDSFLEATQQLRPSLDEFPLEQPTAAKVLECHNYLYGDFEKLFKELKQEDNLRGLQELRLRDGR
jgi:hypothetical protein